MKVYLFFAMILAVAAGLKLKNIFVRKIKNYFRKIKKKFSKFKLFFRKILIFFYIFRISSYFTVRPGIKTGLLEFIWSSKP